MVAELVVTEDAHRVCELEKNVAVLKQKAEDAAVALVLARDLAAARWASIVAVIVSLIGLAVSLMKK
jgi:hypothetical protein